MIFIGPIAPQAEFSGEAAVPAEPEPELTTEVAETSQTELDSYGNILDYRRKQAFCKYC